MEIRGFRLFCWIALLSIPAAACQCGVGVYNAPGSTIREITSSYIAKLDSREIVFLGTVERQDIRSDSKAKYWTRYRLVRIRVTETFRGPRQENLEVITGLGGGDCAFDFETGESYLVYAGEDDKGRLVTGMCTHTTLAEYAGPDIRVLRGEPPAPDDLLNENDYGNKFRSEHFSRVCGKARKSDGSPFREISVLLERKRRDGFPPPGYPKELRSGKAELDGSFCIDSVRRGTYILSAQDYDRDTDVQFAGHLTISIGEGKAVDGLNLLLHRDLLYSLREHSYFFALMAVGIALTGTVVWFIWRRRPVM